MFLINEDKSIYVTRGDAVFFTVSAEENGSNFVFQIGDVVRIKVTDKKDCYNVVMQKDFVVQEATENVDIILTSNDTRIGEVISRPVDYWYEVELNPFSNPQTILGYDDDGAKIFKLFPEGKDFEPEAKEDLPYVDEELSLTSTNPIQNQAVANAILRLDKVMTNMDKHVEEIVADVVANNPINAELEYDAMTEELTLKVTNVGGN